MRNVKIRLFCEPPFFQRYFMVICFQACVSNVDISHALFYLPIIKKRFNLNETVIVKNFDLFFGTGWNNDFYKSIFLQFWVFSHLKLFVFRPQHWSPYGSNCLYLALRSHGEAEEGDGSSYPWSLDTSACAPWFGHSSCHQPWRLPRWWRGPDLQ